MSATPDRGDVEVENFARVFVKRVDQVPADAQAYYNARHGVYFKLHLDHVSAEEAEPLLAKARERFDLELVRRATKGDVYKERVYIDHPSEAPEGHKVHTGPNGGLYYESGLQQVGVNGGETRNVALIHWDDVELGDEIVFEADSGEQFAEIVDIDERPDAADIIHVETDEGVERALPGTYTVDVAPEEKSEGTMTSGTEGAHSARYSPEDDDEDDLEIAIDKFDPMANGHDLDPATGEGICESTGETIEAETMDDLTADCPHCDEPLSMLDKGDPIEKEWVPYTGPQGGKGWRNRRTGEIRYQEESPAVEDGEDDEPGATPEPEFDPTEPPSDGYASGWTVPPESADGLQDGQALEYFEDGYGYGEVVEAAEGSVTVETETGETTEIDLDSITATEIDRGLPDLPDVDVTEATPEEFNDAVRQRMDEDPEMAAFLTEHDPEEFEDYTLLTAEGGLAGAAVSPEGDIQNVFALDDAERFTGRVVFEKAIEAGGRTLDCYDGYLRDFYDEYGFRETGRMEFNPEFAPEGFNEEKFGHPDVVFMHYAPEDPSGQMSTDYYDGDEWGDAKQDSRRAAAPGPNEGEAGGDLRRGERGSDSDAGAAGRRSVAVQKETADSWVSFVGPQGGQGWVNLRTGEKRYQAARPGPGPEDYEEEGFADGWDEPPEDPTDLLEGQTVEVWNPMDEEYEEAEVVEVSGDELRLDAEGLPTVNLPLSDLESEGGEITAVEEIGDRHPADPEMVSLDPTDAEGWAQQFSPGDEVWLDTSNVTVVDEPAFQMDVMGYVAEGPSQGWLATSPTEEFEDGNPDVSHIAVNEDNLLSEEEAEAALSPYDRMEDFGWEVGDQMFFRDTVTGELHDAEIIEPIDGQIAFETDEGATYFPQNDEHMEIVEPDEYSYDPADFGWREDWEMDDIGPGGAVWSDSMNAPYRVASAPHPSDEHVSVFTEDGNEWLPIDDIPVYSPNIQTPPEKLGWYSLEVPDAAFEDEEAGGPDDGMYLDEPRDMNDLDWGPTDDLEGYESYLNGMDGMDPEQFEEELKDHYVIWTSSGYVGEDKLVDYDDESGMLVTADGDEVSPVSITQRTPTAYPGSEGSDDVASGYDPDAEQIPEQGPHTGDYDGYDTDGMDEGDWTPLTEVSDETVDEGDHVMVVLDYDHKEGKEAMIGEAYPGDTDWKIDVHNHDQPDWNLGKPVNNNDVEAYIATPHADFDADGTTTPSEDEAASAVAEPADGDADVESDILGDIEDELDAFTSDDVSPAEYTPEAAKEFRDMSDIGANHGNSVAAMEVAVLPDGSKMVHKDLGHDTVETDDVKREMVGYEAAKLFDDNVPVHTADIEDGWAASEVAPGVDAKDATPEIQQAVDDTDFHEMAAAQLIIGNTDLHQNNVRVDEDGRLYPFDLDRAGGDLQGEWVGNLSQYEDTLDRTLGEMEKAATALGVQMDRVEVLQRATQKAEAIEIETDLSAAADWDVDLTDVIADNIEALRNGEVTL